MERSRATIDGSADSDATAVDDPEDGAEESEDPDETDSEEDEEEEQVANTFESPADPSTFPLPTTTGDCIRSRAIPP